MNKKLSKKTISYALLLSFERLNQTSLQVMAGLDEGNMERYFRNLQEEINLVHSISDGSDYSLFDDKTYQKFTQLVDNFLQFPKDFADLPKLKKLGFELRGQMALTIIQIIPEDRLIPLFWGAKE